MRSQTAFFAVAGLLLGSPSCSSSGTSSGSPSAPGASKGTCQGSDLSRTLDSSSVYYIDWTTQHIEFEQQRGAAAASFGATGIEAEAAVLHSAADLRSA